MDFFKTVFTEKVLLFEKHCQELNVRQLTVTMDKSAYGVKLRAEPDHRQLGKKLGSALKEITPAIKALTDEQIEM